MWDLVATHDFVTSCHFIGGRIRDVHLQINAQLKRWTDSDGRDELTLYHVTVLSNFDLNYW